MDNKNNAGGAASSWKLVPIDPTENMVTHGFESWPDRFFSKPEDWAAYEAMSGCQQAAHRARLCWAAMLAAAPTVPASADNPSTAGTAELSKDRIAEVGLKLRIQAFENAKFRADEGSAMTGPEQDEFNQQVEFARAIWILAAPVEQSTAGAANVLVPRATLEMIYGAMNHMGDILNGMDACEEEDEEATTPAFDAMRELLDDSPLAAPAPHAQPEPAEQVPTDISQRLRTSLANCGPGALLQPLRADIMAAAEEIERYYGGMLAWKKTAEKKDRDWQAERMGRVDDRIAARDAAEFAAAQVPTAAEVRDQALKFADDVISNAFDGGDLDGATIQEMAEARGLIKPQTMAEPCGVVCGCMESGADFPAACYRKTYAAVLRTTSKAQASAHSESGGDDA